MSERKINLEDIFLEEIDEPIASNFSNCSSLVEIIDGFGIYKGADKSIFVRKIILKAMKEAVKQALELAAENVGLDKVQSIPENADCVLDEWDNIYIVDKKSITNIIKQIR